MHLTQGTFSYLPELSDEQIDKQVRYALEHDWPVSIEFTDDPHPRNSYWEMWGPPMFDLKDPAGIMDEVRKCREEKPAYYIKLNAYDRSYGRQTTAFSFIIHRPPNEKGFRVERAETHDRMMRYTLHSYAADRPHDERYTER